MARRDAAQALLSVAGEAALGRHVGDPVYGGLFVNLLATHDPTPWVGRRTEMVRDQYEPRPWWGGRLADAFRAYCAAEVSMDLSLYFDRVDRLDRVPHR